MCHVLLHNVHFSYNYLMSVKKRKRQIPLESDPLYFYWSGLRQSFHKVNSLKNKNFGTLEMKIVLCKAQYQFSLTV